MFKSVVNLISGRVKQRQIKEKFISIPREEDLTLHLFKFLLDNKLLTNECFKAGMESGKIKDFNGLCMFYET